MTTQEAAEELNYTRSNVSRICRKGGFTGVQRLDKRTWIIPREAVINYKPGPQGFAAVQQKKIEQKAKQLADQNAAIREAKGLPNGGDTIHQTVDDVPSEYISVAEAAEMINMSRRYVRSICSSGKIVGARKLDKDWQIPFSELKKFVMTCPIKRRRLIEQSKANLG